MWSPTAARNTIPRKNLGVCPGKLNLCLNGISFLICCLSSQGKADAGNNLRSVRVWLRRGDVDNGKKVHNWQAWQYKQAMPHHNQAAFPVKCLT